MERNLLASEDIQPCVTNVKTTAKTMEMISGDYIAWMTPSGVRRAEGN